MQRTSHALAADGRVWLFDVVDDPELDARVRELGEPAGVVQLLDRHNRDCAAVASGSACRTTSCRGSCRSRRSSCARSCATAGGARSRSGGRSGASCSSRTRSARSRSSAPARSPPASTPSSASGRRARSAGLEPEHLLVGHGEGIHHHPAALESALRTARRRIPRWLAGLPACRARPVAAAQPPEAEVPLPRAMRRPASSASPRTTNVAKSSSAGSTASPSRDCDLDGAPAQRLAFERGELTIVFGERVRVPVQLLAGRSVSSRPAQRRVPPRRRVFGSELADDRLGLVRRPRCRAARAGGARSASACRRPRPAADRGAQALQAKRADPGQLVAADGRRGVRLSARSAMALSRVSHRGRAAEAGSGALAARAGQQARPDEPRRRLEARVAHRRVERLGERRERRTRPRGAPPAHRRRASSAAAACGRRRGSAPPSPRAASPGRARSRPRVRSTRSSASRRGR